MAFLLNLGIVAMQLSWYGNHVVQCLDEHPRDTWKDKEMVAGNGNTEVKKAQKLSIFQTSWSTDRIVY